MQHVSCAPFLLAQDSLLSPFLVCQDHSPFGRSAAVVAIIIKNDDGGNLANCERWHGKDTSQEKRTTMRIGFGG